uniref:Link domain-containing protein n=1 Tax=viral metagenome TaxID=1070528 RepID=A0A6C0KVK0_9ZZZZ
MEVSTSSTTETDSIYDYVNAYLLNPSVFIIIIVIVVLYIAIFLSLGNNNNSNNSEMFSSQQQTSSENNPASTTLIVVSVSIFVVLIIINGLQYFFNIDIVASIKNLVTGEPQIQVDVTQPPPEPVETPLAPSYSRKKQVFNIPGNYYGYEDAKSLCKAYGSELATYSQIEDSYKNGGEWCNYGWSYNQMALFPTQQATYDQLQTIPGHEHDCGRPGVNGGYIDNPHVKFGVNCYGYKPRITTEEEEMMQNTSPYPKTAKDIAMEKRVDYWKTKISEILVSPFNYNNWNS